MRFLRRLVPAAVLAAVTAATLTGSVPVAAMGSAVHVTDIPRVGALYFPSGLGLTQRLDLPHHCSGSVVASPGHNLVLTAAHCVYDAGLGYQFAPGYHDGQFPYGLWTVRRVYVDPAWRAGHDPAHDWAFLAIAPLTVNGKVRNIQDLVGGYPLASAPPVGATVTVDGYVAGHNDEPITCTTVTYRTVGFPSMDCDGFANGTSGGPWLEGGQVVGVIGGLHQGGCTPSTSYSAPFGADTVADYARAVAGGAGDSPGFPGSDGC